MKYSDPYLEFNQAVSHFDDEYEMWVLDHRYWTDVEKAAARLHDALNKLMEAERASSITTRVYTLP